MARTIRLRRSWSWSVGGTGKYPSLCRGRKPRLNPVSLPLFQIPSSESMK